MADFTDRETRVLAAADAVTEWAAGTKVFDELSKDDQIQHWRGHYECALANWTLSLDQRDAAESRLYHARKVLESAGLLGVYEEAVNAATDTSSETGPKEIK